MHVLTNSTPLPFAYGETLQPGEWLLQDDHAFILAAQAPRGTASIRPWLQGEGGDRCGTVILRSGAIGDLLLASPAIEAFRKKHPGEVVGVACFQRHIEVVGTESWTFFEYPVPFSLAENFRRLISLENVIEMATERGQHATDAFADALGVIVTDYRPVYEVTEEEKAQAPARTHGKPRVAIHLRSSSHIRDYPLKKWFEVISTLVARGWEVMLLGNNDQVKNLPLSVKDCSKMGFRQAAAVLATCDVFAGVDSSFFNLCPALDVPAVGLFGPVDWKTRIKDLSKQLALKGDGCEPCHWTSRTGGRDFPAGKPCNKDGCCVLLDSIEPKRIVAKIEKMAKPCA